MRGKIIDAIYGRMADDPSVFFLTADMGINLVEKFEEQYPERFCNVGIAEQNLVGVSSGLVNAGYRPLAYTISNFMIHRCFEQVRNDVGIHNYPVTLMGTSAGFDNAPLGPTHHVIDDWGALRSTPGIDIYCPSSLSYSETLVDRILEHNRPAYIRIPKGAFLEPKDDAHIVLKCGITEKVLLVSYGGIAQNCLEAAETNQNLSVMIFNRLRPIDEDWLSTTLARFEAVVVVEDHFPYTGLYGTLCELIARKNYRAASHFVHPLHIT